jgi:hypothetical protein
VDEPLAQETKKTKLCLLGICEPVLPSWIRHPWSVVGDPGTTSRTEKSGEVLMNVEEVRQYLEEHGFYEVASVVMALGTASSRGP